jgi:hypothetical protein
VRSPCFGCHRLHGDKENRTCELCSLRDIFWKTTHDVSWDSVLIVDNDQLYLEDIFNEIGMRDEFF